MPEKDRFDQARDTVAGLPGYQVKASTVRAEANSFLPQASFIIETVRTNELTVIFIQSVGSEGAQRIVLPDTVTRCIYRHYDSQRKEARSMRARNAAETRKRKAGKGKVEPEDEPEENPGNMHIDSSMPD